MLPAGRSLQSAKRLSERPLVLLQLAALLQPAHRGLRGRTTGVRRGRELPRQHGVLFAARDLLRARVHGLLSEHLCAPDGPLFGPDALLQWGNVLLGSARAAGPGVLFVEFRLPHQ